MALLISILLLTCLYWLIQAGLRLVGPWFLWLLFGVLPLLMLPHWLINRDFDGFVWLKLYSVLICVCWGTWFRFGNCGDSTWARRMTQWLLVANIAEAVCVDTLAVQGTLHWINAVAGVLLMLQLISSKPRIDVQKDASSKDLNFDLSMHWIVGYTLWNWTFVALNYQAYLGHHTAVLVAALVVAIVDRRRWVQARAATLGINLLFMALSPKLLLGCCDTSGCANSHIENAAALLTLAWVLAGTVPQSRLAESLQRHFGVIKGYLLGSSMTPVQFGGATRRF